MFLWSDPLPQGIRQSVRHIGNHRTAVVDGQICGPDLQ